jgi:hypothetical protein
VLMTQNDDPADKNTEHASTHVSTIIASVLDSFYSKSAHIINQQKCRQA